MIPDWVLWGVLISMIITAVVMYILALIIVASNSIAGRWLSAGNPLISNALIAAVYLSIGLPSGMLGSYVGSAFGVWLGVLAGAARFVAVPILLAAISKLSK